jgi:Transposase DDE domain
VPKTFSMRPLSSVLAIGRAYGGRAMSQQNVGLDGDSRADLARLAPERGGELYSKRQCMVEPVFAQIKSIRRIDRFKRRGFAAARSDWRLIVATHNLLKLHRHGLQAAGA